MQQHIKPHNEPSKGTSEIKGYAGQEEGHMHSPEDHQPKLHSVTEEFIQTPVLHQKLHLFPKKNIIRVIKQKLRVNESKRSTDMAAVTLLGLKM